MKKENVGVSLRYVIFERLMSKFKNIEELERLYVNELLRQYKDIGDKLRRLGKLPSSEPDLSYIGQNGESVTFELKHPPAVQLNKDYTFIDFIVDELKKADRPITTSELRQIFHRKTGNDIKITNFSSKLNMRQIRTKRIQNIVYKEIRDLSRRGWWGLPEWFNADGDFKKAYKKKIFEFADI